MRFRLFKREKMVSDIKLVYQFNFDKLNH